ncbi:dihydroorotate dehydrogenase [Candidatus Gottesmanbacteria bacterium]|nr:dihydroorotate dehydrogenase [Candidatus Gottesmanbacteria bacterium]
MADLSVTFCGVKFSNPFVLPSGIITEIPEHKKAIEAGVGGVTLKSLTKERREGNPLPRIWKYEYGMLNSVGLRNAGIEKGSQEVAHFLKLYGKETPIIISLFSTRVIEFVELVEKIAPFNPQFIELNLSCPNTVDELGTALGMEEGAAGKVITAVKKVSRKIPILAKLSPNVTEIGEIAKSCEDAGADAIVASNTFGPGMIIDIHKKKPVLGNKEGGVSGPGIFPITVRCVYDIYEAVKIPILAMGGVTKWQDVIEIIIAGATLVGVGTATYLKGMKVYDELKRDVSTYMEKVGIKNLKDIVGVAHGN